MIEKFVIVFVIFGISSKYLQFIFSEFWVAIYAPTTAICRIA